MARTKPLNLNWGRVFAAAALCLGFVGLLGVGIGFALGDDSDEIAALHAQLDGLQKQVAKIEQRVAQRDVVVWDSPILVEGSLDISGDVVYEDSNTSSTMLISTEVAEPKAFLGVSGTTVTNGVELTTIVGGSGAERAELETGDVLTHLDDEPMESFEALSRAIKAKGIGQLVQIAILRDGEPLTLHATLGER